MTPEQCRSARRLLGWSQERLGQAVGLSATIVSVYERKGHLPDYGEGFPNWTEELRAVLEAAGIIFVDETGSAERDEQSVASQTVARPFSVAP